MSVQAWLMMGTTWAVVLFFTLRFLLRILRTPRSGGPSGS